MTENGDRYYLGKALDTTQRQIRLLIVHPGISAAPIICNLCVVNVENTGDYEVLSYT